MSMSRLSSLLPRALSRASLPSSPSPSLWGAARVSAPPSSLVALAHPSLSLPLPLPSMSTRWASNEVQRATTTWRPEEEAGVDGENPEAEALVAAGNECLIDGKFADAIVKYEEALKLDKGNINALYKCSMLLALYPNRWDEALQMITKAISMFGPMSAELWDAKGTVLNSADKFEKYEEALKCLERSIELSNSLPQSHTNLGICLNGLRRFGPAVLSFDKAIQLSPANAGIEHLKGKALFFLGKEEEAFRWLDDKKIEIDSDFKDWFFGLKAFHHGKFDEALTHFNNARYGALVWTLSDLVSYKGECYFAMGKYDEAMKYFTESYEMNPKELLSLHGIGEIHLKKGDKVKAQECFDKCLQQDPIYYKQDYFRVKPVHTSS
eukprot:TRINITY_DN8782_c0_g1_i1.p1 TRINITY_DN8782_c0_g1~~TRINITY_DN8782_c0_g1_i1.p1  ORF type:complete len:381 (+),score=112.74 TRINITY_DN8782_c0_g1_i1:23-1165(+)